MLQYESGNSATYESKIFLKFEKFRGLALSPANFKIKRICQGKVYIVYRGNWFLYETKKNKFSSLDW